jgi:hypothetical protein
VTFDEGAPSPPRCLESDPFVVDLTPARRAAPLEAKPCQIR